MKKHNFSAGPCILPNEVLEEASEAIINFNNEPPPVERHENSS